MIEVTSGLSAGEQVVLSAYQSLPNSGSSSGGSLTAVSADTGLNPSITPAAR